MWVPPYGMMISSQSNSSGCTVVTWRDDVRKVLLERAVTCAGLLWSGGTKRGTGASRVQLHDTEFPYLGAE